MSDGGRRAAWSPAEMATMVLEFSLALLLGAAVLVAVVKLSRDLVVMAGASGFDKEVFLHTLDSALLIVLAIDVIRTLVTAVVRRELPIRIVVETAMLAVLREFIAIEIRKPSNEFILTLTVVFAALTAAWLAIGHWEARRGRA